MWSVLLWSQTSECILGELIREGSISTKEINSIKYGKYRRTEHGIFSLITTHLKFLQCATPTHFYRSVFGVFSLEKTENTVLLPECSLVFNEHQAFQAPDSTTDKKKHSLGELWAVSISIFSINMDMHEPNYLELKEGILKAHLYTQWFINYCNILTP